MKIVALIQAGGLGTRLKSVTGDVPKPLVKIGGRPAIFRLIDDLLNFGIDGGIHVLAGYRGDFLSSELSIEFGSKVQTHIESKPLGSGGCIKPLLHIVGHCRSILLGGDLLHNINYGELLSVHDSLKTAITLTVHGNNHPLDADLVVPSSDGKYLRGLLLRPHPTDLKAYNIVNAAVTVIDPFFWNYMPPADKLGFESDLLLPFSSAHDVGLYFTPDFLQDLGTPERLNIAETWFATKKPTPILLINSSLAHLCAEEVPIKKVNGIRVAFTANNNSFVQSAEMNFGRCGIPVVWRDFRSDATFDQSVDLLKKTMRVSCDDLFLVRDQSDFEKNLMRFE